VDTFRVPGRSREGITMASTVCQLCEKKPWFGKQVSHSHRRSSKRWNPNIQRVKAFVDGRTVKLDVCTSCLKAGKVTRPPVKA
jgi:large subunit ribosomal protein L28